MAPLVYKNKSLLTIEVTALERAQQVLIKGKAPAAKAKPKPKLKRRIAGDAEDPLAEFAAALGGGARSAGDLRS